MRWQAGALIITFKFMYKATYTTTKSINKLTRIGNFGELKFTKGLTTNLPRLGGLMNKNQWHVFV